MIGWLLLATFVAGFSAGGYGVYQYEAGVHARAEVAQAKAQAHIEELSNQVAVESATRIAARQAAFEQGEAQAKAATKTVYIKGESYVREAPQVFTNPQCVLPVTSLQLANSEIADVRAAAAALGLPLPTTESVTGRPDGNAVLIVPGKPGAVAGVRTQIQPPSGAGAIPGDVVSRPPKPNPTGK